MDSIISVMDNIVSVSEFNKGEAGKIFSSVKKSQIPKIVLKRNEPECVLLSPIAYRQLMEELEDLRDYKLAMERTKGKVEYLSQEEVFKELFVAEDQTEYMEDVDIE